MHFQSTFVLAFILVLTVILSSCSEDKVRLAQETVRGTLVDPGSAQFQKVEIFRGGDVVCGEVNAKNRLGGYVGRRGFVVRTRDWRVFMFAAPGPDAIFNARLARACDPNEAGTPLYEILDFFEFGEDSIVIDMGEQNSAD